MLTGKEIITQVAAGKIIIQPFDITKIKANSYDLTIGNKLLTYNEPYLDPRNKNMKTTEIIIPEKGYMLVPRTLYLTNTIEKVGSEFFVPILHGRSSAARVGISAHIAAGLADLGWFGQWTLEITVPIPVKIYPFMSICQMTFEEIQGDRTMYSGKYQGQEGPTASRIWMDTPNATGRK
jgi:dCTP deaminase